MLKPCPKCKSKNVALTHVKRLDSSEMWFYVSCMDCNYHSNARRDSGVAIIEWNVFVGDRDEL